MSFFEILIHGFTNNIEENQTKREGNANFTSVSIYLNIIISGLDNAGKTTLVRKLMGEDITTICPTLGFDIKTLECNGYIEIDYSL